jgi:hypothetical protein
MSQFQDRPRHDFFKHSAQLVVKPGLVELVPDFGAFFDQAQTC